MSAPVPPPWAQEITHLVPACSHFLLSGNIRDKFFVDSGSVDSAALPASTARFFTPELLHGVLHQRSFKAVIAYEMTHGSDLVLLSDNDREEQIQLVESALDSSLETLAPAGDLEGLASLVEGVAAATEDIGLIIKSASRLTLDVTHLTDDEFAFWRRIDELSRKMAVPKGGRWINPVIWLLDRERDVPEWFALNNVAVRSIVIPYPDTGQRERFARAMLPTLRATAAPPDAGTAALPDDGRRLARAIATFRDRTAGLPITALESICKIARERGIDADDIGDAIDFFRTGVAVNPWSSEYLLGRIRGELEHLGGGASAAAPPEEDESQQDEALAARVLGQDRAVHKAVEILARSAMGLTAAQSGRSGTRPRGIMFLAGPTGVGKTELAKSVAKLVFGDEEQLLRFDMSEFSAEQSADRLIGAPPGYVGFNAGGELTNGIRRQPFSVVLFDEIEKAHPLILDKFLQILDDGRLTDGRGDTVHFTDAVIVFTTNLGMYLDVEVGRDGANNPVMRRVVNDEARAKDPLKRENAIRRAIQDHFISKLGRPELLNRIGMDNIVVFDFIDDATGQRILDLMVGRILERVRDEHDLDLEISPDATKVMNKACLTKDVLDFGGRGIGSHLETILVNPLATALLLDPRPRGSSVTLSALGESGGIWHAELK